jgi:hypothetical protein
LAPVGVIVDGAIGCHRDTPQGGGQPKKILARIESDKADSHTVPVTRMMSVFQRDDCGERVEDARAAFARQSPVSKS